MLRDSIDTKRSEVYLVSTGPNKIEVIKVIRYYADLGLKEAKDLAESAPCVVWSDVPEDTAANMVRDLERAGATAEVRGDSGAGAAPKPLESGPTYRIVFTDSGPEKIEVIKVVRHYTKLGLAEAKRLVESAPGAACPELYADTVENMTRDLARVGATFEIASGSGTPFSPKETGTGPKYAVTLTDLGRNKIDVIKVIREYTDLGLKEAKELAESAPAVVCSGVSQETAEKIKRDLEDAGARAEIENPK